MTNLKSYLEENQIKAERTVDDLYYVMTKEGDGKQPQAGDYVQVHYTGRFLDGKVFDSSIERGTPFTFQLGKGQVIKGWDLGLQLLKVGGKANLYLPHELGYGAQGIEGAIPPFASLAFEVELLEILDEETYQKTEQAAQEKRRQAYIEAMMKQMQIDMPLIEGYVREHQLPAKQLPSGLVYAMKVEGTGTKAQRNSQVTVHYEGRLLDGTIFDSSYKRGEPITFQLGNRQVIPGWEEGIPQFSVGGKGTLLIPSPLAYGPNAVGAIPANSVLVFDIELVKVG